MRNEELRIPQISPIQHIDKTVMNLLLLYVTKITTAELVVTSRKNSKFDFIKNLTFGLKQCAGRGFA